MVDIELVFPDSYPVKAGPSLTILQSNLDSETLTRLVKVSLSVMSLVMLAFVVAVVYISKLHGILLLLIASHFHYWILCI